MPRAKLRTPELRERVLAAAVELLEADGVGGFTTRRVAAQADTSPPALYELFGDRAGLVREVFFEGFRLLHARLDEVHQSDDAEADLRRLATIIRVFVLENPIIAEVMFSKPFADFAPGPDEVRAGIAARAHIVGQVERCVQAGIIQGDATDIAHVLLALTLGLAGAESASRLGTSAASIDRRWALAVDAVIDGLRPANASAHKEAPTR